mmetsp:Transcript_21350/g.73629  ORF Transcript_21350/g.73629 Transcript_21350/m.73629 type:complete len:214 (+) Transcript_21350:328-969(+)
MPKLTAPRTSRRYVESTLSALGCARLPVAASSSIMAQRAQPPVTPKSSGPTATLRQSSSAYSPSRAADSETTTLARNCAARTGGAPHAARRRLNPETDRREMTSSDAASFAKPDRVDSTRLQHRPSASESHVAATAPPTARTGRTDPQTTDAASSSGRREAPPSSPLSSRSTTSGSVMFGAVTARRPEARTGHRFGENAAADFIGYKWISSTR